MTAHATAKSKDWAGIALLVAIVAGGAALRFYDIGRKSLWLDEAATLHAVDAGFIEVLDAVKAHDAHPPLYYAGLHPWMWGSHGAMRARAFSAVFSVGTLVVFFALARVLLPRGPALIATLLLAVSAFHVYFAQEARHYTLAAFFVALSWYFFVELLAGKRLARWPFWLGLALANTAALYTFYYSLFSVLAQGVLLLVLWRGIGRKLMVAWVSWQLIPAALFAIYIPVILERMETLARLEPPPGSTVLSATGLAATAVQFTCGFLRETGGLLVGEAPLVFGAVLGLGLLGLVCALSALRTRRFVALAVLGWLACCCLRAWAGPPGEQALGSLVVGSAVALVVLLAIVAARRGPSCGTAVALVWLFGPVVFLALLPVRGHVYEPKHLIFASPALALLIGAALAGVRGRLARVFVGGLAVLALVANAASLACYYHPRVEKENWRQAVADLAERVEPGDIVAFTPPYVELPFHHYYTHVFHGPRVKRVRAPIAGRPFRAGELGLRRRVWVLEGRSNVEKPNPLVLPALQPYPRRFMARYDGTVGQVRVFLHDTWERRDEPAEPAAEPPAKPPATPPAKAPSKAPAKAPAKPAA